MKKVKVGKSKIHGNGLFADEPIKRGDVIELVHTMRELEPGVMKTTPTLLGRNYNHSDDSNALNVVDGNNRYLVALKEIEAGGEITTDYRTNPDLEQPGSFTSNDNYVSFDYDDTLTTPEGFKLAQQMNKEGKNLYVITARDKVTPQMIERAEAAGIPKENIITAGSDEAKVKIVKENNISKHIDNKESVIKALGDTGELFVPDKYPDYKAEFVEMDLTDDDLNKLQEGGFIVEESPDKGIITQEEIDAANNAMMKARLAYAYMHGNPAAQRMVVAPDQPYDFGDGITGTHYMASMDNYAVPQIQDVNGQLMLGDYGPESAEAIRFDTDEDAMYFAENYKDVSPAFEEAELTEEEIEEYRKSGWVVEKLDAYPKGGNPRKGKKQSKNVQPFVTSDPKEYAYRKAAYDDSLRTYQMVPELRKKENYIDNHSVSIKDNQKKLYRLWNEYANKGFNYSLGYNQRLTPIKKIGDGLIAHQIYDYDKPIQPVKFKKPRSKQGATKVTKKEQPVVEQEVIKPTPIPVIINPELQKFVEERRPEPPGPPPGPGTDVMPVYDIDELPMYATPDPDAEWVGETEKYVDWDGNRIPYRLPRFRKPGHGGDLIRRGKQRYIPLPSVESRYQAEIVPEEEYDNGGNVNFQTYEEQLRQLENSIKAGYKGGRWYPHDSPEGGTKTIGYGHKMSGKENYSKGLTTAQVLAMQKKDLVKHKNIAKSMVDQKYGAGTFDRLPESRKVLLVDYAYNGVLHEFPNFMRATVKGDKAGMLKEYKRYTGNKPLTQRNEWTRSVIEGSNVGTTKTNTPKTLPAKTAPKKQPIKQPVKQPVKKPIAQPKFSSNETFSYDYRPDAVYRVADSGDWYINAGKNTHNEFIKLNDPTGKRTETLRKFAHINEVPLDQILNKINNSGNYDSRIDLGYVPGQ